MGDLQSNQPVQNYNNHVLSQSIQLQDQISHFISPQVEMSRETKSKEAKATVYESERGMDCHNPVLRNGWAGRRGVSAVRNAWLPQARVIPVVTFLTPLAEHFSDLKDR
jgi:hypothetical protein